MAGSHWLVGYFYTNNQQTPWKNLNAISELLAKIFKNLKIQQTYTYHEKAISLNYYLKY